jgi:hypothetical protein
VAVANLAGIAPLDDRDTVIAELSKHFPNSTVGVLSLGD